MKSIYQPYNFWRSPPHLFYDTTTLQSLWLLALLLVESANGRYHVAKSDIFFFAHSALLLTAAMSFFYAAHKRIGKNGNRIRLRFVAKTLAVCHLLKGSFFEILGFYAPRVFTVPTQERVVLLVIISYFIKPHGTFDYLSCSEAYFARFVHEKN